MQQVLALIPRRRRAWIARLLLTALSLWVAFGVGHGLYVGATGRGTVLLWGSTTLLALLFLAVLSLTLKAWRRPLDGGTR
jgi:hypothetical protein